MGNVDENQLITGSYSYQSLPGILSFENKQAYWQKLVVPHIKAKTDPDTQEPIVQNGSYVPDDDRATATFTVGNTPGAALPNSGGPGTSMISLLGISLICLACAGYVMKRRRKCETA